MTTTVITHINRIKKTKVGSNSAMLAVWKNVRGLLKKNRINPVQYQRSARKERAISQR